MSAVVIDDVSEEPVTGIELRCETDSDALATTDSAGRIDTKVVVQKSPRCNLGSCNDVLAIDPAGRYLTQSLRFPVDVATIRLKLDVERNPCAAIEIIGAITPLAKACAERNLASAETELNAYVAERVARYRANGEEDRVSALDAAQAAWLKTRDATCGLVYDEFGGGTVAPVAFQECQVADTKQRLARLRAVFTGGNE